MSKLFSLQGKIYVATRDTVTGKPKTPIWLGNVSQASMELTTDKSDKNESFSGNRLLYGSLQKSKGAKVTMTLDELLPENFAMALYGTQGSVTGATITAEVAPTGLVVGDSIILAKPFASAIVVKDSTGSPVTLVLGTDYEITSASRGIIKLLNVTAKTQPFKVDYTYAAYKNLAMFTNVTPPERYVIFDGINTVTGDKILVDLYRMQFDPVSGFDLINEDWGGLQLNAVALYDEVNSLDANLGGFGRLITQ